MVIGQKYHASNFEIVDTKYGKNITCVLDHAFRIYLPRRYVQLIQKEDIKNLNESPDVCLEYGGMKPTASGKHFHSIEFTTGM